MQIPEKVREKALTRLWVVKTDNQVLYFYSLDKKKDILKNNMTRGIRILENLLLNKFRDPWKIARIYENKSGGKVLIEYREGKRVNIQE